MDKFYDLIAWVTVFAILIAVSIWSVSNDSPLTHYRACDLNVYGYCDVEAGV